MKFGAIATQDAVGALLAHSVALPKGRLRKGVRLEQSHIADLLAAGVAQVTVAQLATTDVDENTAAAQLAQALLADHPHLEMTNAFTGRVNLLAKGPGVALLDVAALEAVNSVHPMITLATVPPFQQMANGGMVATIKIISYGVDQDDLARACVAGRGAIRLAPPVLHDATLIITEIAKGAGDKGREAIANRLAALDIALNEVVMVPHQTAALCDAIKAADTGLVLILTGSATSDIDDVAPSALRAAGGTVERFGMPVDPGNLLFLGALGSQQVIGLPGCARSPAQNGADWVLARIACGIAVTDRDIAAMGVGGLLKEIATRPQPRRG
ncbi:molybdopterin-binding protein [Sulfitobacter sp. CW3]|uniref:molybdopterin-binding protein n=1 Tax=Sulfitobacter sp. CW3 TaxID=2861965 RepID=UPI001C5D59A3|nr:molybdopterin-binding protein [Sulfitobacter sp. CW3]MBW4963003.1 molybdopterin-binding protein [Sulfitobacter sp. CW3]